jgi:hypothetical protein
MARIRSVHPGLFTDEAWVSCSPLARILFIGLWTDADDQGVFEWKPLQIKMRLLPGDTGDAAALLAELQAVDLIQPFEHGGKTFGAIRNFRKFQRPKKPNAVHPLPERMRIYVALEAEQEAESDAQPATGSPPVPHEFPTSGEKSPQMEDGGGKGKNRSDANASSVAGSDVEAAFAGWNALAGRLGLRVAKDLTPERRRHIRARLASSGLEGWREALTGVERSSHCRGENDRGWRADLDFVCQPKSFQRLREGFYGGDAAAETAPDWENYLATWRATGRWPKSLGPPPDHPETQVPQPLRAA